MPKVQKLLSTHADLADESIAEIKQSLKERIETFKTRIIRSQFDNALIDTTCLACIELANDLCLTCLANEMIADMKEMEVNNA